jgi:hypothetical protein
MFCPTTFARTHEALDTLADFFKNSCFPLEATSAMPIVHPCVKCDLGGDNLVAAHLLIWTAFTAPDGIVAGINNTEHGDALFKALFPGEERVKVSNDAVRAAVVKLRDRLN